MLIKGSESLLSEPKFPLARRALSNRLQRKQFFCLTRFSLVRVSAQDDPGQDRSGTKETIGAENITYIKKIWWEFI